MRDPQNMSDYKYNATDETMDEWAMNFTNRIGDGCGDHEATYLDMLKLLIALNHEGSLLDIGCGLGRVLEIAKGKIKEIVALEPDYERYRHSHENYSSPGKCEIYNQISSDFILNNPGKKFDLVTLGMVIQHLSTGTCANLIRDTALLVKDQGVAIISTTHVPDSLKGFSFSSQPDKSYLSIKEYNDYAANPETQDKGIPVRRFSKEELFATVSPYFEILYWSQFSYYRPEHIDWFCKSLEADIETLKDFGNSQFVILRKKGSP